MELVTIAVSLGSFLCGSLITFLWQKGILRRRTSRVYRSLIVNTSNCSKAEMDLLHLAWKRGVVDTLGDSIWDGTRWKYTKFHIQYEVGSEDDNILSEYYYNVVNESLNKELLNLENKK